jgi:hypothetical protein
MPLLLRTWNHRAAHKQYEKLQVMGVHHTAGTRVLLLCAVPLLLLPAQHTDAFGCQQKRSTTSAALNYTCNHRMHQ